MSSQWGETDRPRTRTSGILSLRGGQEDDAPDSGAKGNSFLTDEDGMGGDSSGLDAMGGGTESNVTIKHEGLVAFGFEKGKVFYNKAMVVNRDLSVRSTPTPKN